MPEPTDPPVVEAPAPAAPRARAPEPPRELPKFPLGAPGHTGEPVSALGIFDDAEIAALADAGVATIADVLQRAPRAVERAGERMVDGVAPEGAVLVRGIAGPRVSRFSPGRRVSELLLRTPRKSSWCRWDGAFPAEVAALRPGVDFGLVGRMEQGPDGPVIRDGEPLGVDGRGGDWFPSYGIAGVADARMRAGVRAALRAHGDALFDHLPPEVVDKYKLPPLAVAVRDVHFPSNRERKGRGRMAFDELLRSSSAWRSCAGAPRRCAASRRRCSTRSSPARAPRRACR